MHIRLIKHVRNHFQLLQNGIDEGLENVLVAAHNVHILPTDAGIDVNKIGTGAVLTQQNHLLVPDLIEVIVVDKFYVALPGNPTEYEKYNPRKKLVGLFNLAVNKLLVVISHSILLHFTGHFTTRTDKKQQKGHK